MARISTGTGDEGTTGLVGSQRVAKTDLRMGALGAVDEANDALGLAACHATRPELRETIRRIQEDLFVLGADLAAPPGVETLRIAASHWARLVEEEDRLERALPPLRHFVLPGGTPAAASLQLARSITRRAEREAWRAKEGGHEVSRDALVYLNRLSDLLFLLARQENALAGVDEPRWMGRNAPD